LVTKPLEKQSSSPGSGAAVEGEHARHAVGGVDGDGEEVRVGLGGGARRVVGVDLHQRLAHDGVWGGAGGGAKVVGRQRRGERGAERRVAGGRDVGRLRHHAVARRRRQVRQPVLQLLVGHRQSLGALALPVARLQQRQVLLRQLPANFFKACSRMFTTV